MEINIDNVTNLDEAYALVRALEKKFSFFSICVSTQDLEAVMRTEYSPEWFQNRGYFVSDEEYIPKLTDEQIEEFMDTQEVIEECVGGRIADELYNAVEELFPDKDEEEDEE